MGLFYILPHFGMTLQKTAHLQQRVCQQMCHQHTEGTIGVLLCRTLLPCVQMLLITGDSEVPTVIPMPLEKSVYTNRKCVIIYLL